MFAHDEIVDTIRSHISIYNALLQSIGIASEFAFLHSRNVVHSGLKTVGLPAFDYNP